MNSFWKGKNVFITGISGFVGGAFARHILSCGANVTGLIKDINKNNGDILKNCNIVIGDITNCKLARDVIASNEIDIVYHFAATSIVRISALNPVSTYETNIMGTVNILDAVRYSGRKIKVVVASSDKAYGDHDKLPYVETYDLRPKNTYDTSKACMDLIAQSYAHNYGLDVVVTRCSNIYGPYDLNFSRLIPNTILRLLNGQTPTVYEDIEKMEREFIYIDDVIDAYAAVLELNAPSDVYNIGGTGPKKIMDVIKLLCELTNSKVEYETLRRNVLFLEIEKQFIDSTKLCNAVGWMPKTELRDGLTKTIEWYKTL